MPKSNETPIGLFFEVAPNPGHLNHYFSFVEKLKPELEKHDGLIWLNRYEAKFDDYSLLSHQLWDSEKSIEKSECLVCREIYGGSIWRKAMKRP